MKLQSRAEFANELKQKQAITNTLIKKILYSKRLLVDHVEALEQCLAHLQADEIDAVNNNNKSQMPQPVAGKKCLMKEVFTGRNMCILLGSAMLEHFITPRALRLTMLPTMVLSTGFSVVYLLKNAFVFRNKIVELELEDLIHSIDEFGNCIRRNMSYFNEVLLMKQHELIETRQIDHAWDCITAAREVTEILYDATRKLEAQYPLPVRFSPFYWPMEELRDCEYFRNNITDYTPKHIKDFYNIFAYVQSQFLLRLALTFATHPSLSTLHADLVKIDLLIKQLVQEEEQHFKNLAYELKQKQQLEIDELNAAKVMQNRSGPVAVLQDSSLKLSACMVAVAGECQALDITLQRLGEKEQTKPKDSPKQLLQVAQNMRSIESALSSCFDDFQRLMLVYNKFLNSRLQALEHTEPKHKDDDMPDSILTVEISKNQSKELNVQPSDDFYAYMYDEKEAELQARLLGNNVQDQEREILNFEKRLTKGKFRPVLQQLKDRIAPIRQVMFEKEREVLAAKGIDVDEFFKQEPPQHVEEEEEDIEEVCDSADSEGSAELEFQWRFKKVKELKQDQFAEMRDFLARKQAINLFKLDLPQPVNAAGAEDVLCSEC